MYKNCQWKFTDDFLLPDVDTELSPGLHSISEIFLQLLLDRLKPVGNMPANVMFVTREKIHYNYCELLLQDYELELSCVLLSLSEYYLDSQSVW